MVELEAVERTVVLRPVELAGVILRAVEPAVVLRVVKPVVVVLGVNYGRWPHFRTVFRTFRTFFGFGCILDFRLLSISVSDHGSRHYIFTATTAKISDFGRFSDTSIPTKASLVSSDEIL